MWNWTRIALGAGLAGALLLAAPTQAPAGGTIGAATGEFEVGSSASRTAEVASGEAPFEVGEHGYVPLAGTDRTAASEPAATAGKTANAPGPTGVTVGRSGNAVVKPGKEKSADACGAGPSSTPTDGLQKK